MNYISRCENAVVTLGGQKFIFRQMEMTWILQEPSCDGSVQRQVWHEYSCPHCGQDMGSGISRLEPATVLHIPCRKGVWIPPENEILTEPLKTE